MDLALGQWELMSHAANPHTLIWPLSIFIKRVICDIIRPLCSSERQKEQYKESVHLESRERTSCVQVCLPVDIQRVSTNHICCSHIPAFATYQHFPQTSVYLNHVMRVRDSHVYMHLVCHWTQTMWKSWILSNYTPNHLTLLTLALCSGSILTRTPLWVVTG